MREAAASPGFIQLCRNRHWHRHFGQAWGYPCQLEERGGRRLQGEASLDWVEAGGAERAIMFIVIAGELGRDKQQRDEDDDDDDRDTQQPWAPLFVFLAFNLSLHWRAFCIVVVVALDVGLPPPPPPPPPRLSSSHFFFAAL